MEWDAFLPHVLPDAKGCPDLVAVDAVIRAAREFCEETLAWSYECDPILSGIGVKEYALQLGEGEDLVRIFNVAVGGKDYPVQRGARARALVRNRAGVEMAYMNGPLSFHLYPVPRADDVEIVADIAVKPSLTSPPLEWPDDLAEYVEDIARGAIAILCDTEGEDWSNTNRATIERAKFEYRKGVVKREVERGYGRAARPYVSSFL